MTSYFTRRNFVLAASSLGSVMMATPLNVLADLRAGSSGASFSGVPASESQGSGARTKPKVLVFDVNQTLLDLNSLRPHFTRIFGDGQALDGWFSLLLQYSLVVSVTDAYVEFATVGRAALEMMANTRGVKLSSEDAAQIMQGMLALPAHPDVPGSLKRLRAAGFRMVTLTNSSPSAVKAQLQNAGLTQYFDEAISVEIVHRFKPDLQVYRSAAAHLGVQTGDLLMIAAHAWDVFGAAKAGLQTAFVQRGGIAPFPLGSKPDILAPDLAGVADAILK